jgi:hypothetical protein
MNRIIRQAFGNSRPKDVFLNLLTFDRMVTRPVVHIVYWIGLGLLVIGAFAVAGVSVGEGIKAGSLWGWMLTVPLLIVGWLMVMIGVLLWRSMCEFYMAVLSIAEDLRYLRQFQEKLPADAVAPVQPAPVVAPQTVDVAAPVVTQPVAEPGDITETPFFQPRFGKRPE